MIYTLMNHSGDPIRDVELYNPNLISGHQVISRGERYVIIHVVHYDTPRRDTCSDADVRSWRPIGQLIVEPYV